MYSPYFPAFTEPEDILRFIDEDAKKVLLDIPYGGYTNRIRWLASDNGIPISIVRMILIELKKLGLIDLQTLFRDEENHLCGSGYFRTVLGNNVASLLTQGKTYDNFCNNDS